MYLYCKLQAVGLRRIAIQSRNINTGFQEVAASVSEELNMKYNVIRESASEGVRPYANFVQQVIAEFRNQIVKILQDYGYNTDEISYVDLYSYQVKCCFLVKVKFSI